MVEGSHMGVTTDADGRFELKGVKNGTVLAFSFIGMEPAKAEKAAPAAAGPSGRERACVDRAVLSAQALRCIRERSRGVVE